MAGAAPAPPAVSDGLPAPDRYRAMAAIMLGIALSVLDASLVSLALPGIAHDFGRPAADAIWVVNAYQLAVLTLLLPCAALGDMLGYRRVYLWGIAILFVGSVGCLLAGSLQALVAARALQGVGAAGVMGVNAALVRLTYPRALLGRGIALNSLTVAIASVAGPSLAAVVLSVANWPWLFALNLPLAGGLLLLGRRCLPGQGGDGAARLRPLDVLMNVAMFALVFLAVDLLGTHAGAGTATSGNVAVAAALLAAGLAVGVVFVRGQLRRTAPLLPVDLLRIPVFALSMCASVTAFTAQTLSMVALPFLLLVGHGRSHADTGLLMAAWPLGSIVAAPIAGRLIGRINAGVLGTAGLWTMGTGMALLALLPDVAHNADIAWRMALCGIGFALFQSPNNYTIVTSAPPHRAGGASGMLGTARLTGQSTGAVLLAIVFSAAPGRNGPVVALGLAAAFAATSGLFSLLRRRPLAGA